MATLNFPQSSYLTKPQQGLIGNPNALATSGSLGAKATSPDSKVTPPANTLPSGQTAPAKPTGQTTDTGNTANAGNTASVGNAAGNVDPNSIYGKSAQGLFNYGDLNNDPTYQRLLSEYNNIAQSQPVALTSIMNDTTRGIPQSVEQSREAATNDQYSQQLAAKTAQINQYIAGRGQAIGALGSAASVASPRQQGYALLSPFNNAPIGGGGTGGGGLNSLAYWGGTIDAAGAAAQKNVNDKITQQSARSQLGTLQQQLAAAPDFNTDPVNLKNSVYQFLQGNVSNPKFAPIQSTLKNVVAQYSQILGTDQLNALMQGAQVSTLNAFLANLDDLANKQIQANQSIGAGGQVSPVPIAPPAPAPTTQPSGVLRSPDGTQEVNIADLSPAQQQEATRLGWK